MLPRIDKLVETDSRKEGHTVGLEEASVSSDEKVLKTFGIDSDPGNLST